MWRTGYECDSPAENFAESSQLSEGNACSAYQQRNSISPCRALPLCARSPAYVTPASGAASSFDLYVRGTLPTTAGVSLGQIATVGGNEKYSIYWMHGALAEFLFNQNLLLPGQHVAVGGPASGATNAQAVTVNRVMLRAWGFNGVVVPGSENGNADSFQMQVNGFAGVLIPQTVTVYITDRTTFRDGFSDLGDIGDNDKVRVVGLLLKDDPTSGQSVIVGRYIDDMSSN